MPYCTDEDLRSLQSLAAGIYQDMLSVDRQRYCLNIMQVLRKRIAALNQWFEQVIKETLVVDYNKIKETYDKQSKELKRERVRLFTEKIKEKTGKDVNINLYGEFLVSVESFQIRKLNLFTILGRKYEI